MKRKAEDHGELTIDHRCGPGIDAETARKFGMVPAPGGVVSTFKTLQCCHCGCVQVMNPKRTRDRGHCQKCDKYQCDLCTGIGVCRPFIAVADAVAGSDKPVPTSLILPPQ